MKRKPLKPVPNDAITILAATPETFVYHERSGVVIDVTCRDCECALLASEFTLREAVNNPDRHGRPIGYLCRKCAKDYDWSTLDQFHDCRPRIGNPQSKGIDRS